MSGATPVERPRSGFVSVAAWLGIISAASCIVLAVIALPWQRALRYDIGLLCAVAAATLSLGVRKRREWARQGFVAFLAFSTLMGIAGAARWRAAQSTNPPADSMRMPLLVVAGLGLVINLIIILKLRSRRVREEFDAASAV